MLGGVLGSAAVLSGMQVLNPSAAWAADVPFPLYDPWSGIGLTRTWAAHNNGGLDINVGQGHQMLAPHAGTVSVRHTGACGNELRITNSGWKSVFFHLSGYIETAGAVALGEPISYSGGATNLPYSSGTDSTGPHVHWHLETPQGVRVNPRLYLNGGITEPHDTNDTGATMRMLYNSDNPDNATRRAMVGEFTFQVVTAAQSTVERRGLNADIQLVNVTQAEWNAFQAGVETRRAALKTTLGL